MLVTLIWILILPYIYQTQVHSLVCRGIGPLGATSNVEWMVSLQLPRSHSNKILYMDALTNAKDGLSPISPTPPEYLFNKYHSASLGLTNRTSSLTQSQIEDFRILGTRSYPKSPDEIFLYTNLIEHYLNEFYVWFNDQDAGCELNIKGHAGFEVRGERWSHSKMQFATSHDNSGYLLDHSYTQTPFGFHVRGGGWSPFTIDSGLKGQHAFCFSYHPDFKDVVIQALRDIRPKMISTYLYQDYWNHLDRTDPWYNTRAPYGFDYNPPAFVPSNLYLATFQAMNPECGVEWQKLVRRHSDDIMGILNEPLFEHCTKIYDITGSSGTNFRIITHKPIPLINDVDDSLASAGVSAASVQSQQAPVNSESASAYFPTEEAAAEDEEDQEMAMKSATAAAAQPSSVSMIAEKSKSSRKGKRSKKEQVDKQQEEEYDGTYADMSSSTISSSTDVNRDLRSLLEKALRIGPDPWLEVSKALGVPLYVSTWHNLLPSIMTSNGLYGVLNIYSHIYEDKIYQTDNVDHSKYAISTMDAYPWVCFGDTNRKASQTDHAGLEICFLNAELREQMLDMIHQIDVTHMINPERFVIPDQYHPSTYYYVSPAKRTKVTNDVAPAKDSGSDAGPDNSQQKRSSNEEKEEVEKKANSIEEAIKSAVPGDVIEWEIKQSGMKAEMNAKAIPLSFDPVHGPILQTPRGRLLYPSSGSSNTPANSDVKWKIENDSNEDENEGDDDGSKKRSNRKETYSEKKKKKRETEKKGRLKVKN